MRILRQHPFLALGLFTALCFVAVEAGASWLEPGVRILVIPMYIMRMIEMLLGFGVMPRWLDLGLGVPLLFAPYLALDAMLAWYRDRRLNTGLRAA